MTDDNNTFPPGPPPTPEATPEATPPPTPQAGPGPMPEIRATAKKRRRWPGMLARLTGTLTLIFLSMLVSIALAMAWLSSEDGRAFLAAEAESLASSGDMTVELGPITRLGLRHLDIDEIQIRDAKGEALSLSKLSLTINITALLAGRIHVNELKAAAISFDHAPQTGKPAEPAAQAVAPVTMPALTVDKFILNNIHITATGDADETSFNAAGRLQLSPDLSKTALSLDITRASDDAEVAHLRAEPAGDDGAMEITAHIADDGTGLLAAITGLPRINVDISGAGPSTDWKGTAKIDMGDGVSAEGALAVAMQESAATLTFTGNTNTGGMITTGKHVLTWYSQTGQTTLTFTGKAEQGELIVPQLAIEGTLAPRPAGGTKASLTALARRVEPYLDGEAALALNAVIDGPHISVANSYLRAKDERVNLSGKVDTAKKTLSFKADSKIASLGKLDTRFGGSASLDIALKGNYANGPALDIIGKIAADKLMTPWEQATILLGMSPSLTIDAGLNNDLAKIRDITLTGADGKTVKVIGKTEHGLTALDISGGLADYTVAAGAILKPGHAEAEVTQLTGPFGTATAMLAYDQESEAADGTVTWRGNFENTLTTHFSKIRELFEFNGNASGKSVRDYALDFRGEGTLGADETTAKMTSLSGTFGINKLALNQPAVLHIADAGTTLDKTVLDLNGGKITLSGRFGKDDFDAALKAAALPANMDIFPLLFDGTIDGDIALSGAYDNPAGKATLALKQITLPGAAKGDEPRYVEGDVAVTLGNSRADFTTELSGTAGLHFNAKGYLPVSYAPAGIPSDKTLSAALDASVDLRALTLLLGLDEHRLAGAATLDLDIGGTLDRPQVKGTGGLEKGRYENLVTGTVLRNITTQISADDSHLVLSNLSGTDKNSGSFTGEGEIGFKSLQNPDYRIDLTAKHLNLVNLDKLGLTASGNLHSQGNADAAAINGDITINNAEYYVTQSIGGDALSDFEVVETGEGLSVQTAEAPPAPTGPDIALDIDLHADHSIFVRGPDLESEWGAKLHLGGTASTPTLAGQIKLLRGQYRLLDTMVNMKKGTIGFTPPDMKDPDLDLSGEMKGHGETAIINVTGSAAKPAVELTSESGLTNDELLAQVLFGKALNELTPVQALRIAKLMAYLSGQGGGGFDPLGAIRRAMGIDALSVSMDDEGGATLSVGKYVSDKVYVSVDQGASSESSAVRAEIEVTDEIEVETSASGASENTVGVNWKHDY